MTNTKDTTQTKAASAGAYGRNDLLRGLAILPLVLGVALVALGVPRLVAAVTMLPAEPVVVTLQQGGKVGDDDLAAFEHRWTRARAFVSWGRLDSDLALAKLARAERLTSPSDRRALTEEAIALLREALSRTPSNSFAWARLAYALALKDGPTEEGAEAWRMSVLTAPADRRLTLWRAEFGIALLPRLSSGSTDLLNRQIRFAWRFGGKDLVRYAKASGNVAIIRAALLDQPDALKRFEKALQN